MSNARAAQRRPKAARRRSSPAPPPAVDGGIYIQQVARMVGVSPSVIRSWEAERLIKPRRTDSGYRVYTMADVERLKAIRDLVRGEGLNLAGVRRVLAARADLPPPDADADGDSHHLGPRLRGLRAAGGLSLRDLAASTGLSPSYISALERSQNSPSVASLQKLAAALGTNLVQLLGDPDRSEDLVVRAGERRTLPLRIPGVLIQELARTETQLEPLVFALDPGAGSEDVYAHEGEEFIYVLDGTFEITLEETHAHSLQAGDAITFSSLRPHRWRNPGASPCTLVWINTPPTF